MKIKKISCSDFTQLLTLKKNQPGKGLLERWLNS